MYACRDLLRASLPKTAFLALRKKSTCITVFPRVHVYAARSASVSGNGRLHLGVKWDGLRYLPSEFYLAERSSLVVNSAFSVYTGFHISINRGAVLSLGSGAINNGVTIDCFESISIGNRVSISKGVTIRDTDNHSINGNPNVSGPIVIEDNVWICLNATVLKGVHIGSGAVVATGAVVTRDVPPNTLVGGVPARVKKGKDRMDPLEADSCNQFDYHYAGARWRPAARRSAGPGLEGLAGAQRVAAGREE